MLEKDFLHAINSNRASRRAALLKIEQGADERQLRLAARYLSTDAHSSVRNEALEVFSWCGKRSDCQAAIDRFGDPEWFVRCSAYSAAAHTWPAKAKPALKKAYRSERQPTARRWLAIALGDCGISKEDETLLSSWLEGEASAGVRVALCKALVMNGHIEHIDRLLQELQSDDLELIEPAFLGLDGPEFHQHYKFAHKRRLRAIAADILNRTDLYEPEKRTLERILERI